jgi:hypothetical protein
MRAAPIPVRPAYPPAPSAQHLQRAAWATVVAATNEWGTSAGDLCTKLFPDDAVARHLLTRAAISGATTSTPAWAGLLAQRAVGEWLGSLVPASAAAALIARGPVLSLTGYGSINVPIRAAGPTATGWVDEAGAIPMRAWSFSSALLSPHKMAVIVVLTKELAQNSNALPIFEAVLREEAAMSLDSAYFSADDGSTAGHHAGLLAGLVAGTGSAVMANDLAKLAETVGANGSGQVVFVMSPGRAAAAAVRMPAEATATVLPSLAVPADRVIAIDPLALVHGFGSEVELMASEEPLLHMSDTPLNIASGAQGSGVLATPAQSMFQTAMIATRLIVDVSFAARRSGAIAFMNGCTW